VVSTDNPINIAYSNVALDLHQDLPYYESPPGVQLLHCLKFGAAVTGACSPISAAAACASNPLPPTACTSPHTLMRGIPGGETFLADAFAVARRLRAADPALFRALLRHPVTFSKVHFERQYPASLQYRRPVVVVSQDSAGEPEILSVNWSPQFEAPLHIDPSEAALFYQAYRCDECARSLRFLRLRFNPLTSRRTIRLMSQLMAEAPQLSLRLNEVRDRPPATQRSQRVEFRCFSAVLLHPLPHPQHFLTPNTFSRRLRATF
jgi:hypothetical protein